MLRITRLRLELDEDINVLRIRAAEKLKINVSDIKSFSIYRKSLDARKKNNLHFVITVDVEINCDEKKLAARLKDKDISIEQPYVYTPPVITSLPERPIVIGAGPAGLFAALILAEAGAMPLILERGFEVDKRTQDVEQFWQGGKLNPNSNVQFGEGGAGAFSDGKLNTGIKDSRSRKVLNEFVRCGAPEDILFQAKPHIGTDRLKPAIRALRQRIISLGGSIRFGVCVERLVVENGHLAGVRITDSKDESHNSSDFIPAHQVILAIGHSARDTFENLYMDGVPMEQKPFSLGVRIEHLQSQIDSTQYGRFSGHPALGAADYRLAVHLPDGRGVYTFCMCPGGSVVAAASEKGMVVTNGMSNHARLGVNANSALLVGVGLEDFPDDSVLSGVHWQQSLERAAFELGGRNYYAPVQLVGDFLQGVPSRVLGDIQPTYRPGFVMSDLSEILPKFVTQSLRMGLRAMQPRMAAFTSADAVLTGIETRSSSPVRILRGYNRESPTIKGLYPCGEGAGYAGGIMSAAVDGIRTAEMLLEASNHR